MEKISLIDLFKYVSDVNFQFTQIDTSYSAGPASKREPFFDTVHSTLLNMLKLLTAEQKASLSADMKNNIKNTLDYCIKFCSASYKGSHSGMSEMV